MQRKGPQIFGVSVASLEGLAAIVTILGLGFGVVGFFWGILEFSQRGEAERARVTLEYLDDWTQDGARASYTIIANAVSAQMDLLTPEKLAELGASTQQEQNSARASLASRALRDPVVFEAFVDVEYYFNRLSICVQVSLCSRGVAKAFFEDTIVDFVDTFNHAIDQRQDNGWKNFGESTRDLLNKF